MAATLLRCGGTAEWLESLQAYPDRVAALGKDGLEELDRWYRGLPAMIADRGTDAHINAAELVRTVEWKLKRGKWRPRLLDFVKAHSDDTVQTASRKAFQLAASGKAVAAAKALAPLTVLKGIGPATASAVLAAAQPAYPFFSDEAAAAVLGSTSLKYNLAEYEQLVAATQAKAAELNAGTDGGEHVWTASDVERSLWSHAAADRPARSAAKKGAAQAAKRKAAAAVAPATKRKSGGMLVGQQAARRK